MSTPSTKLPIRWSRVPWLLYESLLRPVAAAMVWGHVRRADDADGRWRTIAFRPMGPESHAVFDTVVMRSGGAGDPRTAPLRPDDPWRLRCCPAEWVRDAWIAEGLCPHCLYPLSGEWFPDPCRGHVMVCTECGCRWKPGKWLTPARIKAPPLPPDVAG